MELDFMEFITRNQSYNYHYHSLLQDILNKTSVEENQRTGTKIKAIPNRVIGYSIANTLPLINTRKMFPVTAFAELCWTLSGEKKLDWLQQHTKMWDDFKNESNEVEAAYGYRWRKMFGRDQLIQGIEALKKDPSDRQIFISAWDNSRDGLGNRWTSNVPCPVCFCLNIIDKKLNLTLLLRSSDTIVGLPYDMLMYSLLLIVVTHELRQSGVEVGYGRIDAILSHAHIYESHFEIAEQLIKSACLWQEARNSRKEAEVEASRDYVIQDIDLAQNRILWELQTVSNIIKDKDTAMMMFKDCLYSQFGDKQKFPRMFKPEIIK